MMKRIIPIIFLFLILATAIYAVAFSPQHPGIDMKNRLNITNFFGSACSSGFAVQSILPDGSFTCTAAVSGSVTDTVWNITGSKYIVNISGILDVNETVLNITIAAISLQNIFQTIIVSSGTNPIAGTTTDSLNISAGTGMIVTGDSGTNTIILATTLGTQIEKGELANSGSLSFDWVDSEVADTLTIDASSSVAWTSLNSYPVACPSGSWISELGDAVTCTALTGSGKYIEVSGYAVGFNESEMNITVLDLVSDRALNGTCPSGSAIQNTSNSSSPDCVSLSVGGTEASGGVGIEVNASGNVSILDAYQLPQSCNDGEIAEWNTSSMAWDCAIDNSAASGMASWRLASSDTGGSESITDGETVTFSDDNKYLTATRIGGTIFYAMIESVLNSTINDLENDTTYTAGDGLTLTDTQFSLTSVSAASSVDNSGRTYIQDITFDVYGRATATASATETVVDTNCNSSGSCSANDVAYMDFANTGNLTAQFFKGNTTTPVSNDNLVNKEYVDSVSSATAFDFFFTNDTSDLTGVFNMTAPSLEGDESTLVSDSLGTGTFVVFNWSTQIGHPLFNELRQGIYDVHIHLSKTGSKSVTVTPKLYNVSSDGSVKNLLVTFETSAELTGVGTEYDLHGVLTDPVMLNDGERLTLEIEATMGAGGSNVVISSVQEGTTDSHLSVETSTNAFSNIFIPRDGTKALTDPWNAIFAITAANFIGLLEGLNLTDVNSSSNIINQANATGLLINYTKDYGQGLTLTGNEVNHTDTSSQSSSDNSGNIFIQDIVLDTFGHITSMVAVAVDFANFYLKTEVYNKTESDARFYNSTDAATFTSINVSGGNITNTNWVFTNRVCWNATDTSCPQYTYNNATLNAVVTVT